MKPIAREYQKPKDYTTEFQQKCDEAIAILKKARKEAESYCPFGVESMVSSVKRIVRDMTQIVDTVSDYYELTEPRDKENV